MTLAMKRMQNVGWLALVFIIAIMLYPLSLNVAAVHSDLVRVDRKIMETKREINFLEAELATRANVSQLDEWNELLYGYEPPTADQFLEGERALASLNGESPVVKPVMVSVAGDEGIVPSGEIGRPGAVAAKTDGDDQGGHVAPVSRVAARDEARGEPTAQTVKAVAKVSPAKVQPKTAPTRTERLASIDERLLSDSTLKEIQKKAKEEQKRK